MNTDIPPSVRAAIADIAAGRRPNVAVARSKAAAPFIREYNSFILVARSRTASFFKLTALGRAVAEGMMHL